MANTDRGAFSLWGTVFSNATWLHYIEWFNGFFLNLTLLILMSKQKFKHNLYIKEQLKTNTELRELRNLTMPI